MTPPDDTTIPLGLCQCGCGQPTRIARYVERKSGINAGEPRRYLPYHNRLKSLAPYLIEDRGYKTPCWVWQRVKDRHGYGLLHVNGQRRFAHQVYFEQRFGPIPDGLEPDHLCRVRACINPEHLEAVTRRVNARRGARTKLTPEQAAEIRSTPKPVTHEVATALAAKFGMSVGGIRHVIRGERWAD